MLPVIAKVPVPVDRAMLPPLPVADEELRLALTCSPFQVANVMVPELAPPDDELLMLPDTVMLDGEERLTSPELLFAPEACAAMLPTEIEPVGE